LHLETGTSGEGLLFGLFFIAIDKQRLKESSGVAFLQQQRICYVIAEEPQYGTQATIPFLPAVTANTAYVRLPPA